MQYSIRMKEAEYTKALKAKDETNKELNTAAIASLKEDLATTIKEFNSIPAQNIDDTAKENKKPKKWWQTFFPLKTETNTK
ncbi:MAG: hypothetical protein ABJB05_06715 [Parafilimonas sp.]